MICDACGHEARDGYRVNPETGRVSTERTWCVPCYEALHARQSRDAYRSDGKRSDDHAS